jgi:hypothetical protein
MIRKIRVRPYEYEVRWTENHPRKADGSPFNWDEKWGYTDNTHQIIYVHPTAHPNLQRVILMHEVLHAAAFVGGIVYEESQEEEKWVTLIAPLLLAIFDDNPALLKEFWP